MTNFEARITTIRNYLQSLANDLNNAGFYAGADQFESALSELEDIEQDLVKDFEVKFTIAVPFTGVVRVRNEQEALETAAEGSFYGVPRSTSGVDYADLVGYEVTDVELA